MPLTYFRNKRYWRQFHQYPFELNDEFGTPHVAVLPSPQICQPGPGSWLVTDLDSRMSIPAGGGLLYAGGGANWDRCILVATTPFARKAGMYCEFETTPTNTAYLRAGWNFNQGTSGGTGANGAILYNEATIYLSGGGFINLTDGLDVVSPLYPYVNTGTSYTFRIYDTGHGWLYYVRPTLTPNAWTLLWERTHPFPHLPHFNPHYNNHSLTGTSSHFFVRQGLAKPPVANAPAPHANLLMAGAADSLIDVEIKAPTNAVRVLVFRYADANNYWFAEMNTTLQTYKLRKVAAGVTSTIASTSLLWLPGAFYRLSALTFANHIRLFSGVQSGPSTDDTFNQTAVLFGLGPTAGGGALNDGDAINLRCQTGGTLLLN